MMTHLSSLAALDIATMIIAMAVNNDNAKSTGK